jgi:hypothetical protein
MSGSLLWDGRLPSSKAGCSHAKLAQPGVPVTTPEEIQDVLFASLAGRVYPFDEGSFDRWRPQRLASGGSPDSVFAKQLATQDLVLVSSSPIRGASLTTLVAQGTAWTVSGADMLFHGPTYPGDGRHGHARRRRARDDPDPSDTRPRFHSRFHSERTPGHLRAPKHSRGGEYRPASRPHTGSNPGAPIFAFSRLAQRPPFCGGFLMEIWRGWVSGSTWLPERQNLAFCGLLGV